VSVSSKVDQFITDSNLAHRIIHGAAGEVVQTEGGPVPAFATALEGMVNVKDRLSALETAQSSGMVGAATRADMEAATYLPANTLIKVTNDVVAANNGTWRKTADANAPGWIKSADDVTHLETRTGTLERQRGPGLTELFDRPNLFTDRSFTLLSAARGAAADGSGTYTKGSGASLTSITTIDGRPALSFTTTSTANAWHRWMHRLDALGLVPGDRVSGSFRLVRGDGPSNGYMRFLMQQFDSAGAEITAARAIHQINNISTAGEQIISFPGVSLDPAALSVALYVDSATSGASAVITDYLLVAGSNAEYRPPMAGRVATPSMLKAAIDLGVAEAIASSKLADTAAAASAATAPNLLDFGSFDFSALGPIVSGIPPVVDRVNGTLAWKMTATSATEVGVYLGSFPIEKFKSGRFSVSVGCFKAEAAATGVVRALVLQYKGSAEIANTRQQLTFASGGESVNTEIALALEGVVLDPSCTHVRLYLGLNSATGVSRSAWFRNMILCDGNSAAFRLPSRVSSTQRIAFVGPTGSDGNAGTASSPFATLPAALAAIGGDGEVMILPGTTYTDSQRFDSMLVKGKVTIRGVRSSLGAYSYDWPIVRLGTKVSGITKTIGQTKVYQAEVASLPSLANFQWAYQDGVADPRTLISADDRSPEHRGRANRLDKCTKLLKTTATTLAGALAEIDASSMPKAFVDSGVLYFSIVGGGDARTASIWLDASAGLVSAGAAQGSAGSLTVVGLDIRYGGLNLTPFLQAHVDEVSVTGAQTNAVPYNVLSFGTLEVCCAGSWQELNGDGLNGHTGARITFGQSLYAHDNHDDGFSDHEGCTHHILGGLAEYNGGGGMTPAYGADGVIANVWGRRNQQRGEFKAGSFYVTGSPTAGAGGGDGGVDTIAMFVNCVDVESRTGFADDFTTSKGSTQAMATCVGCKSIRPTVRGFNVYKAIDCSYLPSSSSSARNPSTVVHTTAPLI